MSSSSFPGSHKVVNVQWQSHHAELYNSSVKCIIEGACGTFGLASVENQLTLVGIVDGVEVELTDETVKNLDDGASVRLVAKTDLAFTEAGSEITKCLSNDDAGTVSETRTVVAGCTTGSSSIRDRIFRLFRPSMYGSKQPPESAEKEATFSISIRPPKPKPVFAIDVKASSTILEVKQQIQQLGGPVPDYCRLMFNGQELDQDRMISEYGIKAKSILTFVDPRFARVRKPVVYLFPPRPLENVTVTVQLVPHWSFEHLYPPAHVKTLQDMEQEIQWTVSAAPDGTLVDHTSKLEVSYLFWEALANTSVPPSPPPSPLLTPNISDTDFHFDPAHPTLAPSSRTTVLLPASTLLPYLDNTLKRLSLHTAARTDFLTFWLPAFAPHTHVALRFLPQSAYARAAALDVMPTPDVVTRVFMLFRGVAEVEAKSEQWAAARERVGTVDWADVVGVRAEAVDGVERFRVLEWGGMEVTSLD